MIDLHTHTNISDGQYSPKEVIKKAADKGAIAVAITDHDRISGLQEGAETALELGLEFIPGVEISVRGNRELHILGYYIDYFDKGLIDACDNFLRLREERGSRIFTYLAEKGVPLDEGQVMRHVPQGIAGRPHFARAMVEAGYVSSIQEAFDLYLGTPEFDSVERTKPSAEEGLHLILAAGGIPVLAHPNLLKLTDEDLEDLVAELVLAGLKGIEAYYSTHTKEQTAKYLKLAEKFNLLVTCGSDFHGEQAKPGIEICGSAQDLSEEVCRKIIKELKDNKEIER